MPPIKRKEVTDEMGDLPVIRLRLDNVEKQVDKIDIRTANLERAYWVGIGIFGLFQFLTGSGVISLSKFLGVK